MMRIGPTQRVIINVLEREGPMMASDLTDLLEMTEGAIRRAIDRSHESKLVHIHSYHQHRGVWVKDARVWAAGPGRDARRPKQTEKERERERQRRYREANRATTRAREAARKRATSGYSPRQRSVFGSMVAVMTG